jgi:hypothetical protein
VVWGLRESEGPVHLRREEYKVAQPRAQPRHLLVRGALIHSQQHQYAVHLSTSNPPRRRALRLNHGEEHVCAASDVTRQEAGRRFGSQRTCAWAEPWAEGHHAAKHLSVK